MGYDIVYRYITADGEMIREIRILYKDIINRVWWNISHGFNKVAKSKRSLPYLGGGLLIISQFYHF